VRPLSVIALATAALLAAGTAGAGGWATIQLSSTPTGLTAGEPWDLDVTVLEHGNPETPVPNASPTLTLRNERTGQEIVYTTTPAGALGVYHVRASFPEAGAWRFEIFDGFTQYGGAQTHTYAPVTIAEPAPPAPPSPAPEPAAAAAAGSFPALEVALGLGLALCALAIGLAARRGRVATTAG
jgi:hypothetical protein